MTAGRAEHEDDTDQGHDSQQCIDHRLHLLRWNLQSAKNRIRVWAYVAQP